MCTGWRESSLTLKNPRMKLTNQSSWQCNYVAGLNWGLRYWLNLSITYMSWENGNRDCPNFWFILLNSWYSDEIGYKVLLVLLCVLNCYYFSESIPSETGFTRNWTPEKLIVSLILWVTTVSGICSTSEEHTLSVHVGTRLLLVTFPLCMFPLENPVFVSDR